MIEKILERLEEKKKEHLNDEEFCLKLGKTEASVFCSAKARAVDGAIEIVQEVAKEYETSYLEQLVEAKINCSEDSDCSECPFGQIEDRCILAELRSDAKDGGWIPVEVEMPREHPWAGHKKSNEVFITFLDGNGEARTNTDNTYDGKWRYFGDRVIAWMPKKKPAPYQKGE